MIQIIIVLAIMQMGFNLLFKPKYNQLACGLFGAAADDVSKININKLKILGIYNDIRGGHSCGMSIDGDIIMGTYKNKLFKDFISEFNITSPHTLPVVLGHTRMATGGAHTEDNAHPFGFGSNGDYYDFIGTHNGTLHNEDELAEEYNVSEKATCYKENKTSVRFKIDSEILLEIISENGFDVLEKYNGAAALAMYNTKKPKTLYLYHGMSPKTEYSKDFVEERPLYYYQESENVVYYSSLKNSLEAINDTDGKIGEFEHNFVYEIKNGNVANAKKHKINRNKCIQGNASCNFVNRTNTNHLPVASNHSAIDYSTKEWCHNIRKWVDKKVNTKIDLLKANFEIYSKDKTVLPSKCYYRNLRFWINNKLADGIYVLNKQKELVYISTYMSSFDVMYNQKIQNNYLFFEKIIPLYFVKGIRLITDKDYVILQNHTNYLKYTTVQLSHCSVYPIRDLENDNSLCYFNGSLATTTFSSIHDTSVIKLINGTCTEIYTRAENDLQSLLSDDNLLLNNLKSTEKIINLNECKFDDEVFVEMYKENILATVEYCVDDCDVSLTNIYAKSQIKSKLKQIELFVTKLLTI